MQSVTRKKVFLLAIVSACISLNAYTFIQAYPETLRVDAGCCTSNQFLAKDFSAYYTATWRLFHDPSNIYVSGVLKDGAPQILPQPDAFKYLPSFLLLTSPLLVLNYQHALIAFDLFQFSLLPLIAYLVWKLLKDNSVLTVAIVTVIAILLPFPVPGEGISVGYFWQWAEGQSKVLSTALILTSFYLGKKQKAIASGAFLALASFDPRFLLVSIPAFAVFNRKNLDRATASFAACLLMSNIFLLDGGVGNGFLSMIFQSGVETPLFYYAYIPLLTVVLITSTKWRDIYSYFEQPFRRSLYEAEPKFSTVGYLLFRQQQIERSTIELRCLRRNIPF